MENIERRRGLRREQDQASAAEILNLKRALASRHIIGMAQGMLMHRYGLTEKQAFDYLTRRSQETNIKVRDLAHIVVQELGGDSERPAHPEANGTPERPTS